ncbi:acyl carrier protein [bacterium]|nr:acyl carrier protein [bacterium]
MINSEPSELRRMVFKVVAKLSERTPEELTLEDKLVEDLDFDSLKGLEAFARLTGHFKIKVDLDVIGDVKTVGDILAILEKQLN